MENNQEENSNPLLIEGAHSSPASICAGLLVMEDGTEVNLLQIQSALNRLFQQDGNNQLAELSNQISVLTGLVQGPYGEWRKNDSTPADVLEKNAVPVQKRMIFDPENMNEQRAEFARQAMMTFMSATGTDAEDAVSDLLNDLMHYSDSKGYDFDAELQRARRSYVDETSDPQASANIHREKG